MIVRACAQCSELCNAFICFIVQCVHMGKRVVAAGAMKGGVSGVTTIGLEVVTTGMVARGLGMTTHHPQSAVATRVGGTQTQSAVANGSEHQPAVAIRVRGTKTQSAVASGSQAVHGSTTQPAVALRGQAINGNDPSQL